MTTEEEAQQILSTIIPYAFYLRVERGASTGTSSSSPKQIQIVQQQMFLPTDYYAWFYEGSQLTTYIGGVAMVAIMLAGVMFPLWPPIMRLGVWYLSIGVLGLIGLFFAIAIVRLIFYIITVIVASPGIWIFPKLFADVGFVSNVYYSLLFNVTNFHDSTRSSRLSHYGNGTSPRKSRRRNAARNPRNPPKAKARQPPLA